MASTYSALKYELMATGEDDGTWGDKTNANILAIQDTLSATGQVIFASADINLTLVDSSAAQAARDFRLAIIGTSGGPRNLTIPAVTKMGMYQNATADTITIKNAGGTGSSYPLPTGKSAFLVSDSVNVFDCINYLAALTISGNLTVGGTLTVPNITVTTNINAANINLNTLNVNPGGANITGLATFNSGLTVAGTATFTGTTFFNGNVGIQPGATLFYNVPAIGSILKVSAGQAVLAATPGTDYAQPGTASTWTALQSFNGSPTASGMRIVNGIEVDFADPIILNGPYTWNLASESIVWAFTPPSGDFSLNIQGSPGVNLGTFVANSEFITITFIVTQGATTFKLTSINFSGTAPSFVHWAGGSGQPLPLANTDSMYTFAIRTVGAGNNHQVFASMTSFG